jgi:hypothetical protein
VLLPLAGTAQGFLLRLTTNDSIPRCTPKHSYNLEDMNLRVASSRGLHSPTRPGIRRLDRYFGLFSNLREKSLGRYSRPSVDLEHTSSIG